MSWLGDLGSAVLGGLYAQRVAVAAIGGAVLVAIGAIAWRRGWLGAARRHRRRSAAVLVPALALALPVAWYLASPLVLSSTIDEPEPASIAVAASTEPGAARPAASTGASSSPAGPTASGVPTIASTAPALRTFAGTFHGSDEFHFGEGTARLIETAPGRFVVRLEGFSVRNGPDLYVYLSPDPSGYTTGSVELGRLKADRGNQNYPVPAGAVTDPSRAASVVIWCKQFSHLFATAPLART